MRPSFAPEHIPPELAWDNSYAEFTHELYDPFVAAGRLHEGPPVVWARDIGYGNSGWLITRNELFKEALPDTDHFSSRRESYPLSALIGEPLLLNPIEYDPPQHTLYRRILNPFFTPAALKRMDEAVRGICEEILAEFVDRGSCEFIDEFASQFPSYVFMALLGLPRERLPQFLEWEHALLRGADNVARAAAGRAIVDYLRQFMKEQRTDPSTDLMRALFTAEIEGRPLEDREILGILFTFYVGGLDTVNSSLGWIFHHLALDRPLLDRLRERPDDIPLAVEEFTRAFAVASATRSLRSDLDFHGAPMRKGESVLFSMCLANRDPAAYPDPHKIDIDRPRGQNLNFASGPHTCLGMHLARREIRIVLETLLPRLNRLRMQEGAGIRYHTGLGFGLDYLPLAWD